MCLVWNNGQTDLTNAECETSANAHKRGHFPHFIIYLMIWLLQNSLTSNEIAARYRRHIFFINFMRFNMELRTFVEAKNIFGKIFGDAHFCHLINS